MDFNGSRALEFDQSKAEYVALGVDAARLQRGYILRIGGLMLLVSLLGGACTIAVGYLAGLSLAWLAGIDRTTAIFASVPGGAAEMAVLGQRFGARVDRVAVAHSLRILIVVALVHHGSEPVRIEHGMRIAQMVLARVPQLVWEPVAELTPSTRGEGGFGHTGVR